MQIPLEISFREVEKTETLENLINEEASKLEQVHNNLISCRVAIEKPHEHQQSGSPFRVRIDVRVPPGHELVVKQGLADYDMHAPLHAIIKDAFESSRRRLKKLVAQQRGEIKKHPQQETTAVVHKLFPEDDYGFLRTVDGQEVYFHRNSVLHNDFDRLKIGTGVRFVAEAGEKGLQASTVQIVDKPGARISESDESKPEPPLGWEDKEL